MEGERSKVWLVVKIFLILGVILWVVLFATRNWEEKTSVDWVFFGMQTNVGAVMFVSVALGIVVGVLLMLLPRRRRYR